MQIKKIHIVSFTIPYPPNYGGIIDVFYKIKALWENQAEIILHCFEYDREKAEVLLKYCKQVYYYPRKKSFTNFLSVTPFIVKSRSSNELFKNLMNDDYPIIFEGVHTTYCLPQIKNNRKIIIRTHNIEHNYYRLLAKKEMNFFKKIYYLTEALKLKFYETTVLAKGSLATISPSDQSYFIHINPNSFLVPAFHSNKKVTAQTGFGKYILFHGNLSVNENIQAVHYIIKNLCPKVDYKFVFAGKDPAKSLIKRVSKYKNAQIIANPSNSEMDQLVNDAHINLLITFQDTGIKLKLINALFKGRFCLVNNLMVNNTGLEQLTEIADHAANFIKQINYLMQQPYGENELNKREQILLKIVNNNLNAQKIITLLQSNDQP
ncbi:MAG: glycosyltransferase [Bacteroidales bacterium]